MLRRTLPLCRRRAHTPAAAAAAATTTAATTTAARHCWHRRRSLYHTNGAYLGGAAASMLVGPILARPLLLSVVAAEAGAVALHCRLQVCARARVVAATLHLTACRGVCTAAAVATLKYQSRYWSLLVCALFGRARMPVRLCALGAHVCP
jgi:hypothetical protein